MACVALALAVAACGDSSKEAGSTSGEASSSTTTASLVEEPDFTLEFEDGELVGGFRREEVGLGDAVRVLITGELTERIHLHGYDVFVEPTGGDAVLAFDALIPGRFEMELEESSTLLVQLTVS